MSSSGDRDTGTSQSAAAEFTTTHWSVVLAAGQSSSPAAQAALEQLCRRYWYPIYAYVRRRGYSPEDAQDLTQSFFERLLERDLLAELRPAGARFRSFLLHTMSDSSPPFSNCPGRAAAEAAARVRARALGLR